MFRVFTVFRGFTVDLFTFAFRKSIRTHTELRTKDAGSKNEKLRCRSVFHFSPRAVRSFFTFACARVRHGGRVAALDDAGCYGFEGSRVPLRATAPQTGAKYLK